jgi:hypothetical protein
VSGTPRDYMRRARALLAQAEEARAGSPYLAQTLGVLSIANSAMAQLTLVVALAEGRDQDAGGEVQP